MLLFKRYLGKTKPKVDIFFNMIASDYKIVNDPVYGFIKIPKGIILDIVEHPYFQRLRRIKQLGFADYIYPGAGHSRFHHALGALHLMTIALDTLISKGVMISKEEYQATQIAIVLHDVGHGPFSHALEGKILPYDHEEISLMIMNHLNQEMNGALDLALTIFKNEYDKRFFYQLISGQLDVDRMDYLKRDSFFTGVAEGSISHERILSMLHVKNDQLVVEEKGIYSIENFLVARHLMYWQVYLHKTAIATEQMLNRFWDRLKELILNDEVSLLPDPIYQLAKGDIKHLDHLAAFSQIDDVDILYCIKRCVDHQDPALSLLAKGLAYRRLFKIELKNRPFTSDEIENIRLRIKESQKMEPALLDMFVCTGKETSEIYSDMREEIGILTKSGIVRPLSSFLDISLQRGTITKYFLCYPPHIM